MRLKHLFLAGIVALSIEVGGHAADVVGYVSQTFYAGQNWFGNPLDNAMGNLLQDLFPTAPNGATVSLWNSETSSYTPVSTFNAVSGLWSENLHLPPGIGANLEAPAGTSHWGNTFVGRVLHELGIPWDGVGALNPPPPHSGPGGVYLLSSIAPLGLGGDGPFNVFQYVVGRSPMEGEIFTRLDAATQKTFTTKFVGGTWDNGIPTLPVGGAGFFELAAVPEPASATLVAALGLAAFAFVRSRRSARR